MNLKKSQHFSSDSKGEKPLRCYESLTKNQFSRLKKAVMSSLRLQEYRGEEVGHIVFSTKNRNFCAVNEQGRKALIEAKKIAKLK